MLGAALMAQTETGSIGGFVKDPSGGVVPKANVKITNEGTGATETLTSDGAGYYTAPNLPPGIYTISADAPGFKRFESAHNWLAPNTSLSLDASLTVGATTETVEVTATAGVLQTESSAVQSEVGGNVVNMQELNGRDPLFEAQLLPGMRGSATMGDFNYAEGVTEPFNVNGTRQQDTLVTSMAPRPTAPEPTGRSSAFPMSTRWKKFRCLPPTTCRNTAAPPAGRSA